MPGLSSLGTRAGPRPRLLRTTSRRAARQPLPPLPILPGFPSTCSSISPVLGALSLVLTYPCVQSVHVDDCALRRPCDPRHRSAHRRVRARDGALRNCECFLLLFFFSKEKRGAMLSPNFSVVCAPSTPPARPRSAGTSARSQPLDLFIAGEPRST